MWDKVEGFTKELYELVRLLADSLWSALAKVVDGGELRVFRRVHVDISSWEKWKSWAGKVVAMPACERFSADLARSGASQLDDDGSKIRIFVSLTTGARAAVPCGDDGFGSGEMVIPPFSLALVEAVGSSKLNGLPLLELRDVTMVRPPGLGARRLQRMPINYRIAGTEVVGRIRVNPSVSVGTLLAEIAARCKRDDLWELVDVDGLAVSEDVLVKEFASSSATYLIRLRPPLPAHGEQDDAEEAVTSEAPQGGAGSDEYEYYLTYSDEPDAED